MKPLNLIVALIVMAAAGVAIFGWVSEMSGFYGLPIDSKTANLSTATTALFTNTTGLSTQMGVLAEEGRAGDSADDNSIVRKGLSSFRLISNLPKFMVDFIGAVSEGLGVPMWGGVLLLIVSLGVIFLLLMVLLRVPGGGT